MMTDPIADLLTRIRNATRRGYESIIVPASKFKAEVLRVMKSEGFIQDYEWTSHNGHSALRVDLKYIGDRERRPVIREVRRVSKPGLRAYVDKYDVPRVQGGLGIAILSTSSGVKSDRESRRLGIGGEVVCYIW